MVCLVGIAMFSKATENAVAPYHNFTGRDPAGRCVVFYHIAKTAGGTITSLLKRAGASSQRLSGETGAEIGSAPLRGAQQKFTWSPAKRAELFFGHFPRWGDHMRIGDALGRSCFTAMVIRDPLSHTMSRYFWERRGKIKLSEEGFLQWLRENKRLRLGQIFGLAGDTPSELTASTLSMLHSVDALGLTEDIHGFLSDFNRAFGLSAKTMTVGLHKGLKVESSNGLTIQHSSGARESLS